MGPHRRLPRSPSLLALVFAGCAAQPTVPPAVAPLPAPPAPVAPAREPAPEAAVTGAERFAQLLAGLERSDEPRTLLLGLEVEPSYGYRPLYDADSPKGPSPDKYRTLVVRYENGRAEVAGELPFLAVPQARGFLYMGVASYDRNDTEAERRRLGQKLGADDEYGSKVYWYAGSSLWRTTSRAKVDEVRARARRALERRRTWGVFEGEDIGYVTSRALCTSGFRAEWTGGAHAFTASEKNHLSGFEKTVPEALSAHVGDAGLVGFARDILLRRNPGERDPDVSLDKPSDVGWGEVDWRKDSRACLDRERGRVHLTGVVTLPNNTARSSEWEVPVKEAPPELAPSAAAPIDFVDIQRAHAFPKPKDALVAPGKSLLVLQLRDRFVVYGAGASAPLLSIPVSGRIVMAEWASGDAARAWAKVGDPPKPPPAGACSCEPRAVCVEGACVTPKRVFVTSTLYTGDLGGLRGADAKCQERAEAGALDGRYKAWLSDSSTSAAARLAHAAVPYVLVDGALVAKDWAGLIQGRLLLPIQLTELGELPTITPHPNGCGDALVWTNTKEDGSAASTDRSCRDWTDGTSGPGAGQGAVWGLADHTYLWSSECASEQVGCNGAFPLFCVEQ
jgi:hypothetical protein